MKKARQHKPDGIDSLWERIAELEAERDSIRDKALRTAAGDVCMYCGNRVMGYSDAKGPNSAGNYIHRYSGHEDSKEVLCAASAIWARVRALKGTKP